MPKRQLLALIDGQSSLMSGLDWAGEDGQRHAPGRFYSTNRSGAITTQSIPSNSIWFRPFTLSQPALVKSLRIEVTTLAASGFARMGFYSELNNLPNTLLVGSDPGTLNTQAVGVKLLTYTPNLQLLADTVYWSAFLANAAVTVRAIQNITLDNGLLGYQASMGAAPMLAALTAPFTFAALPATAPTPAGLNASNQPLILYEV